MTKDEWKRVIFELKDCWPTSRNYQSAAQMFPRFAYLPADVVHTVIRQMFDAGRSHGPTFSEIKNAATELARSTGTIRDERAEGCGSEARHVWAIIDERNLGGVKAERLGHCAVCHTEKWFAADDLKTSLEIHEAKVPTPPPPPDDELPDGIAP